MKFTHYFVDHPVTATIINCLIVVVGLMCLHLLPLREYPKITFPAISVMTSYPNASSELVESSITTVLENQLAGIEGLSSITSRSRTDTSEIVLNFLPGTSMEKAMRTTQDAVALAKNRLPQTVRSPIIQENRDETGLPFIAISLAANNMDMGTLTHFANLNLKNTFQSIPGVSSIEIWGQPYAYQIQLDPKQLFTYGVNVDSIINAIAESQIALPAGKFQTKIPTTIRSTLNSQADYENLLIKGTSSEPVPLKLLSNIQFATDQQSDRVKVNGKPGIVLAITKANDADPINVSNAVLKLLPKVQAGLPQGMKLQLVLDQATFVKASIHNIQSSIIEAIILVLVIVLFFLRNIRATLIPLITIPISLLGSLIFLKIFGFSINLMTILAMVLAVGLVVDDAIVVLENIWRHIEAGKPALLAAKQGASEIGFAIVAMTLTLASVYAPIAFISGTLGQLFIEFSVALAGSVIISGLVALILSPLMCALILGKQTKPFLPSIDRVLQGLTHRYLTVLSRILNKSFWVLGFFILTLLTTGYFFMKLPHETAPKEDRGIIGVYMPADLNDNISQIENKMQRVTNHIGQIKAADNSLTFTSNWGGFILYSLKPHALRKESSTDVVNDIRQKLTTLPSLDAFPWSWDNGLPGTPDSAEASNLQIALTTTESYKKLFDQIETLKNDLTKANLFDSVRHRLRLDSMSYVVDLDRNTIAKLGIYPEQIAKTISVFFSGDQSLQFSKDGILYNINIEGKTHPWDLSELYITANNQRPVSLSALATLKQTPQPKSLEHYNQLRSSQLTMQLKPNESIVQGMQKLQPYLANLPAQFSSNWLGAAKSYDDASNETALLFCLSLLFIYAILAIQFENFTDPLIILTTVPLAASGAILASHLLHQSFNIFTQVGLITLIGLISKHGILIVEFANQLQKEGYDLLTSIQKAASLRLRPILMTTGAMLFGAIPLVLSNAAGSEPRRAIGTVLIGGLSIGTIFTLVVLPCAYYSVRLWQQKRNHITSSDDASKATEQVLPI